jgi:hypothetical protein
MGGKKEIKKDRERERGRAKGKEHIVQSSLIPKVCKPCFFAAQLFLSKPNF